MRDHPIPPVTEPLQYRAIGVVRGVYKPKEDDQLTRGILLDADGNELETVVLGRVLTLMRRHLAWMNPTSGWFTPVAVKVTSPLQMPGSEPSTLSPDQAGAEDSLTEGDDFFSVRELIYEARNGRTGGEIRQQPERMAVVRCHSRFRRKGLCLSSTCVTSSALSYAVRPGPASGTI